MPTAQDKLDLLLSRMSALEDELRATRLENRVLYRQIEALFALYHQIDFRLPPLGLRGWAISPDVGAVLATLIQQHQPRIILEAGAGQSTLIAAYCVAQLGQGHVFALEHKAEFAGYAQQALAQHDLTAYATVLHAPLKAHMIHGTTWQWYDTDVLPQALAVDVFFIDGPTQYAEAHPLLRYPALPLLEPSLAEDALLIMDDADRADEQQVFERWQREFDLRLLRHYESAHADSEKGIRIFQVRR